MSASLPHPRLRLHSDYIGSTTNVTNATGTTQWTRAFEPFGVKRSETKNVTTAPDAPLQYTGEYLDPTNHRRLHLRARRYDPTPGRFSGYDPLEQALGDPTVSPYAYVANRPTMFVDPSGLVCEEAHSVFGSGFHGDAACITKAIGEPIGNVLEGTAEAVDHHIVEPAVYAATHPTQMLDAAYQCVSHPTDCTVDTAKAIANSVWSCFASLDSDLKTATRRCVKAAIEVTAAAAGIYFTGRAVYFAARTLLRLAHMRAAEAEGWRAWPADETGSGRSLPVPEVPPGLTRSQFGSEVMRWGSGDAAARARIDSLSARNWRKPGSLAQWPRIGPRTPPPQDALI